MGSLKDLLEEAKRRTILVAVLVLIVAYIMSCTLALHINLKIHMHLGHISCHALSSAILADTWYS